MIASGRSAAPTASIAVNARSTKAIGTETAQRAATPPDTATGGSRRSTIRAMAGTSRSGAAQATPVTTVAPTVTGFGHTIIAVKLALKPVAATPPAAPP
ncbi:hypothetical protein [Frankia sp. Cas3]|uniref:hypothetical protein n=1 Tax=Frankia sp. Cas3 TaxID=3073926 RepID=UPI002AD36E6B|nr:hypothetical protein [Frankia sp. Cas3]